MNPCLYGAHETPVSWEEHLSPGRLSSEDLEVSAGKVGILDLKSIKINAAELPKSGRRRLGLSRPSPRGSGQAQILQEPGTSGTQKKGKEKLPTCGTNATGPKLSESK